LWKSLEQNYQRRTKTIFEKCLSSFINKSSTGNGVGCSGRRRGRPYAQLPVLRWDIQPSERNWFYNNLTEEKIMARKRKQGVFEDLIDITAMLPWWVGVLLAIIAYLVLHHYANSVVAPAASLGQMGNAVAGQLGKTLAMFGQYILPIAFIIGAGLSAYRRQTRAALFTDVHASSSTSALNNMSWQEFEMLVGEAFRRKGYTVAETGGGGADGGVDLVLRKGTEKFLVQCKQWKAYKVGVSTIRELYGVMAAEGAVGGFVVTSGVFSADAKSFAEGRNINLIGGSEFTNMIKKFQVQPQTSTTTSLRTPENVAATAAPSCPNCGSAMVKRTAKQGANMGNVFWGCSGYPKCRGIIPIRYS
jgi:restriction system protein